MIRFVSRQLGLAPGERSRLIHLLLLAVTLFAVNILSVTLAEALFLTRVGAAGMPFYYLLLAATSIPIYTGFAQMVDRLRRPQLLRYLLLAALLAGLALRALLTLDATPIYFAVYVSLSLIELLIEVQFSVLLFAYLTSLELKRGASLLTMAPAAGGLLGGGLATLLSGLVPTRDLLLVVPALHAVAIGQLSLLERSQKELDVRDADEEGEGGFLESLRTLGPLVRRCPIVVWLALNTLLAVLIQRLTEFQVFRVYASRYPSDTDLTGFLGLLGAAFSVLEFVIIFFLTRPLIQRLGVSRMNLVYPTTSLACLSGLAASSALPVAIAAHVNFETLAKTIDQPTETLNYNAVPPRFLGRLRVINEGLFYQGGVMLAGVLLAAAQRRLTPEGIALVGIVLSGLYLAVGLQAGRSYLRSLIALLRSRSVDLDEVGEGLTRLPGRHLDEVRDLLRSGNPDAQILGLELATRTDPAPLVDDVRALIPLVDVTARPSFMRLCVAFHHHELTPHLRALLGSDSERVREMAVEALVVASEPFADAEIGELLRDPNAAVGALAAVAALRARRLEASPAASEIRQALAGFCGDSVAARAAVVRVARATRDPRLVEWVKRAREGAEASVRREALEALAALAPPGDDADLGELATAESFHPDPSVRAAAYKVLGLVGRPLRLARLAAGLEDPDQAVRDCAAAALAAAGEPGVALARPYLASSRPEVVDAAIAAVGQTRTRAAENVLFDFLDPTYAQVAQNLRWLRGLSPGDPAVSGRAPDRWALLRLAIEDGNERAIHRVLHVLSALGHGGTLRAVRRLLRSPDPRARADAVETLASLRHRRFAGPILPLLEERSRRDAESDGPWPPPPARGVDGPAADADAVLAAALQSSDRWIRAAAHTVLVSHHRSEGPAEVAGSPEVSRMNRLLFLKRAALFRDLRLDDLIVVGDAIDQREFVAGETIFREGDLGDDFFLIFQGTVSVRKRYGQTEREIARLSAGEPLGEMALFDDSPRSATAVAASDCTLLALARSRFHTLLVQRPEIAVQICRILSQRLREANDRLGGLPAGAP